MISIHALREEGDLESLDEFNAAAKFLSTPSARRATVRHRYCQRRECIFIHALREEGDDWYAARMVPPPAISIHALREEGDA